MKGKRSLAVYTLSHFAVDFACFYFLFGSFYQGFDSLVIVSGGYLLYNIIAFGSQAIFGLFLDRYPGMPFGLLGILLLGSGLCLNSILWLALMLVALGNALFHVGGGRDTLCRSEGKMTGPGIFVSSGALGVSLGTVAAGVLSLWTVLCLLALCALSIAFFSRAPEKNDLTLSIEESDSILKSPLAVIVVALLCIVLRAYVGGNIPVPWKAMISLGILPGVCAFLGKALGGFLGEKLGGRLVGVWSLVLCIPLFLFGTGIIATGATGILLFNMTMPITLWTVARRMPEYPGTAFGLTTLALLWGTVPTFFSIFQPHCKSQPSFY